jgi:hypothetical protein
LRFLTTHQVCVSVAAIIHHAVIFVDELLMLWDKSAHNPVIKAPPFGDQNYIASVFRYFVLLHLPVILVTKPHKGILMYGKMKRESFT